MKQSCEPNLDILYVPIDNANFCLGFIFRKHVAVKQLLSEEVGAVEPHVAFIILGVCVGFCKLVHLARTTPPLHTMKAFELFDENLTLPRFVPLVLAHSRNTTLPQRVSCLILLYHHQRQKGKDGNGISSYQVKKVQPPIEFSQKLLTQFETKEVSWMGVAVIGGDIATHFHLDTQMSLPTGLCKNITLFVVAKNHITTPFAGNSMMVQGNLRAQWAGRTIRNLKAKATT
ncbi:hypothetical protein EMCRGX_G022233 [Ephydatia muelleri]